MNKDFDQDYEKLFPPTPPMNEIEKLKPEHARYKKALGNVGLADNIIAARKYALEALTPPTLPPPTIAELCEALRKVNSRGKMHNITFFSDGSGRIKDGDDGDVIYRFDTLRDALDFLNGGSHE